MVSLTILKSDALEYYFFTFAHHLVNPLVVIPEYDLNITIYTELVMQYLKHFLPLSSAAVITQPEVTSIPYSDEYSEFELPRRYMRILINIIFCYTVCTLVNVI